jgi:uncharacterized membrane protein
MSRVEKSVSIEASPDEVITYVAEVTNHPGFIPALTAVDGLTGDPKSIGTQWEWTYEMVGVALTGTAETVAYEPGRRFEFVTTGGIRSTFTYDAAPETGGTRLTITVTYDVPEGAVAKALDVAVVEAFNDRIGARAADNLQTVFSG